MTDERVSDERLQEWTHENYPNNTVKKLSLEVITLRQQNKELLADAERLADCLVQSELHGGRGYLIAQSEHKALMETIGEK